MKAQLLLILLISLFFSSCVSNQENWTHYRGTDMNGHSASKSAPVSWSESENILWKTEVEGRGWSSPVVYGDQIWLSSATVEGDRMFAICVDYNSGKTIKQIDLFSPVDPERIHPTNSYATPTPCMEEERVYFHFGTFGTACIDTKKMEVIWKRDDLNCAHSQGPASSPIIYNDLLILHLEGTDVQFITALNKKTGETIWTTFRPTEKYEDVEPVYRKSYQTPLIINLDGKDQLISNGAQFCIAYHPQTGKEIWRIFYGEDSTVAVPLFFNGMVYVNSGWVVSGSKPFNCRLYAVDPTGKGDVTETHVKWMSEEFVPQISTPVIVDSMLYAITERGMLSCRDAVSGNIIWTEKLKGHFDVAMIYAAGNIYFSDEKGTCYVIKPGDSYQLVSMNQIEGVTKATPAILRGSIILRSENHLYKIAN